MLRLGLQTVLTPAPRRAAMPLSQAFHIANRTHHTQQATQGKRRHSALTAAIHVVRSVTVMLQPALALILVHAPSSADSFHVGFPRTLHSYDRAVHLNSWLPLTTRPEWSPVLLYQ